MMNTLAAGVFITICVFIQLGSGSVFRRAESGENETIRFGYDSHTHMLMVNRQATCYIFVLTAAEKQLVHTDAGMRQVELSLLQRINDPNLGKTTVPHMTLHQNILKECGKGISYYHIIQ